MIVQANSWLQRDSKQAVDKYFDVIKDQNEKEVPPMIDLALSVALMR